MPKYSAVELVSSRPLTGMENDARGSQAVGEMRVAMARVTKRDMGRRSRRAGLSAHRAASSMMVIAAA